MAEAEAAPQKRLIIKLYLRRPEKCDPPPSEAPNDSRGQKRRQNHQCNITDEHSEVGKSDAKRSRTVSHEESKLKDDADSHTATMRKVANTDEVSAMAWRKTQTNIAYPARPIVQESPCSDSRISRTGSEECGLKKEDVKRKKEEIPKVQRRMDRVKKMQCWVILKRFMVGRDGWAFKRPLDLKGLEVLGNSKSAISKPMDLKNVKAIGFEEIESKLKNLMYAGPDEFADDMRLVFSHALLYPARNEIHRIGRRLIESFELSWKTLKDKWSKEERKGNKISKRDRVFPELDDRRAAREAHEKKIQKGNKGSRGGSKDSRRCDADKSRPRQKRSGTSKDSCSSFQYKAVSRYCTS